MNPKSDLSAVRTWRASDRHSGIGNVGGVRYLYEHTDAAAVKRPRAEVYRVEGYVPFAPPTPLHRNVYYVPAPRLAEWLDTWGEHAEIALDIRPISIADALREIEDFRVLHATERP